MIQNIKALIVVLVLTLPLWVLARRLVASTDHAATFDLRRNTWLLVTLFAFLSPNIWIYSLFALPVMVLAGRRDRNPAALFVLLYFAVPPAAIPLPTILINELFNISHQRLLCFAVLIPAAVRIAKPLPGKARRDFDVMDMFLIGFLGIALVVAMPYESITNSARRLFLIFIDTWMVYYVFSRLRGDRLMIADCITSWMMAGVLLAPIAMFEWGRSWLLYVPIAENWGAPNIFAFLMRGSSLRAQASAGHALSLGYWLAISWGFFLFSQRYCNVRSLKFLAGFLLLGGLVATLSRGPWLTALLITVIFLLLNPNGASSAVKAISFLSLLIGLILVSPLGDSIIDLMPFVGTVDSGNVDYRKQLFQVSMTVIQLNPFFGNPFVLNQLESLRQGQGIIDLMNGYLQVAMFNGLIGLSMFAGLLGFAAMRVWLIWRRLKADDIDAAFMGSALAATMLGTVFFIATASYGSVTFLLAGVCASYWRAFKDGLPIKGVPKEAPKLATTLLRRR